MKINAFILRIGALLALALLTGCSTPLLLDKTKDFPRNQNGLVFCTFSHEVSRDKRVEMINRSTSMNLVIRPLGQSKENTSLSTSANGMVSGGWAEPSITKTTSDEITLISATTLAAGEYELVSRDIYLYIYPSLYTKNFALKPAIQFTVKPNEVVYLGAYSFNHDTGTNILGFAVPSKIRIQDQDRFNADYQMLLNIRPEWKELKVHDETHP